MACKRRDFQELLQTKEALYFNKNLVVCSDHFENKCFKNKNLISQGYVKRPRNVLNITVFFSM